MSRIIRFSYDTHDPKFIGTVIHCSSFDISSLKVVATCHTFAITEMLSDGTIKTLDDTFIIRGHLSVKNPEELSAHEYNIVLHRYAPFDIKIFAYSPISDYSYCAKILGSEITSTIREYGYTKIRFSSSVIIPWRKD
jgi:hypothetical protein